MYASLTIASVLALPAAGLLTIVGRVSHAYTVALDGTSFIGRVIGMVMTCSALALIPGHLLCKALYVTLQ